MRVAGAFRRGLAYTGNPRRTILKEDYWNVSDDQVAEKTGKNLEHWDAVLSQYGAGAKKSNDTVAYLQNEHGVPRYWARTLTTRFLKNQGG
jgi:hypothetical protein